MEAWFSGEMNHLTMPPPSARASARQVKCLKISRCRAQIAQSVEHQTFNLRVQGSSPCLGVALMFTFSGAGVLLATHLDNIR